MNYFKPFVLIILIVYSTSNAFSSNLSSASIRNKNRGNDKFKLFCSGTKPIITTKDSFVCSDALIQFTITAATDSVELFDRKIFIGNFTSKAILKIKLVPGKHYLTINSIISSSCTLTSDTLIIRNDTLPKIKLFSPTNPNGTGCDLDTITLNATGGILYTFYNKSYSILDKNSTGILKRKFADKSVTRVIGQAPSGCKDTSNNLNFTIYKSPVVTFTSSATKLTICAGDKVMFKGTGASTYQFYKNRKAWLKSFTDTIWTRDLKDGDSIKLEGTNSAGGCKGTTITYRFIVVTSKTVLSCTDSDLTLCYGNNITTFNFSDASSYKLYKNGVFHIDIPGNTWDEYGINDNDVFYAIGTSVEGCKSTSNQLLLRVKKPVITLKVNPGKPICDADSIIFEFSGGTIYELYKNSVLWQNSKGPRFTIRSMTLNDKVYVTGKDSFGCTANSTTFNFSTILPSPTGVIYDKDPDYTHCQGDLVGIKLSGGVFFQLYKNNVLWKDPIGTDTDFTDLEDKDSLFAYAVATNLCRGKSNTIKFTILPAPAKPTILRSGNNLYSSYSTNNQWFKGNEKITGAINQKYTPFIFNIYTVQYTGANGCSSMSDNYSYTTGVSKVDMPGFKIYPNPAIDYIKIETGESGHYKLKLIDMTGKLIKEDSFIGKDFEWHFKVQKGIYQLIISNEKSQVKTQSIKIN